MLYIPLRNTNLLLGCHGDVIYNNFSGYITCDITCKVLYSSFVAYITGSDQFLGSIIAFFLGYVGNLKNWRHNQLCCCLWLAYITKVVHNITKVAQANNYVMYSIDFLLYNMAYNMLHNTFNMLYTTFVI